MTALVDAVRHGHRNVQLALRKAGALLPGHGTELCEAASVGDIDTIRVLIENGVDANEGDANGRTCLHLAACESQMGVIHFLLNCHTMPDLPHARKVEVNPVDINGGTPLDDALRHGNDVVAMLLRQYGAVCAKEGGEAMEEARRAQAKYNKKRFDKDVVVVSNEVLEGAREMRLVAPVGRYLEQLQEMETGIVEFHREIASLVHVIIKTERAFKEAKQPTPSGRARRQVTQEDTREKLGDVIPQLQDWHSAIDSPPSIKTPALRYLANPKAAESDVSKPLEGPKMFQIGLSHEEATVLEESQPRLLAMEALQRLWVVLGCLNDMVS